MSDEADADGTLRVLSRTLASRPLRRVLLAYFTFNCAELATWVAILVWAYDVGGAAAAGLISVIQLVPATLVAPFGAVLGDRMRRGRALALGYALQAITMAATGVALWMDASYAVVAVLAAAAATAVTLTRPVHHAILPDLSESPSELTAANAASETVRGIAGFVGPALGGVLLLVEGPAAVFVVMAAALTVAAAVTVGLATREPAVPASQSHLWASAIEGFREIRHDTAAAMLVILLAAQSIIFGLIDVLGVVLAFDILGMSDAGPGILASALGVGTLLGGAATVVLVGQQRLAPGLAVGILATGVPLAVLGWTSSTVVAFLLLAASGAGVAFSNVAGLTLLQRCVPSEVMARIFGIQEALMMAGTALGAVAAPVLVGLFGARGAFLAAGFLLPIIGMAAWTQIRRLDARAGVPVADLALLSSHPMLGPLPQREIEQLARGLVDVSGEPDDVIVREGDLGDRYYLIREGQLAVSQSGREIRRLGPGDGFGEIALLRSIPRTATVTALTAVELAAVQRDDFLAAVTGTPRALVAAHAAAQARLNDDSARDD